MSPTMGFEIPIHRSLTEQIMIGGVPKPIAIINGSIAAAFVLMLSSFYIVPVCVVVHVAARLAAKKDPQFFEVFKRHLYQKTYYGV